MPFLYESIRLNPPIPWDELVTKVETDALPGSPARTGPFPAYRFYGDDAIDIGDLRLAIDLDHPGEPPCVRAITGWDDGDSVIDVVGHQLTAALHRIARDFATTGDGILRRFTGSLACEDHGEWTRLYVRDGQVVEMPPELIWTAPPGSPVGTTEPAASEPAEHRPAVSVTLGPSTLADDGPLISERCYAHFAYGYDLGDLRELYRPDTVAPDWIKHPEGPEEGMRQAMLLADGVLAVRLDTPDASAAFWPRFKALGVELVEHGCASRPQWFLAAEYTAFPAGEALAVTSLDEPVRARAALERAAAILDLPLTDRAPAWIVTAWDDDTC